VRCAGVGVVAVVDLGGNTVLFVLVMWNGQEQTPNGTQWIANGTNAATTSNRGQLTPANSKKNIRLRLQNKTAQSAQICGKLLLLLAPPRYAVIYYCFCLLGSKRANAD
jgi:hypothetical protein